MKKARIVLDVDEDLKQAFKDRIEAVNPRYTMTNVLALFMYDTLTCTNDEIRRRFDYGLTVEASNAVYKQLIEDAKKKKLLPENFKIGNSRYKEIQTCLTRLYWGEIDEKEALITLNRLRKEAFMDSSAGSRERMTKYWKE